MSFVISLEEYKKEPGITEAQIPDCIAKISRNSIPKGITSVVIPKSVTEIETDAFSNSEDLLSITVDPDNPAYCDIDGVLYSKDKTLLVHYPHGRNDTEFIIPNYVTKIGVNAFENCKNLSSIMLSDHLKTIGYGAFRACGLTAIDFPNSLKLISRLAFSLCTDLTSVVIPSGVTLIEPMAFKGCENLKFVSIPRSVSVIYQMSFSACYSLTSVVIPDSVTEIADNAFYDCDCLTIVTTKGSYADEYAQRKGFGVSYDL